LKTLVLYFSGTGNTYFVADLVWKRLIENNHHADLISVENFKPETLSNYDLLVFGYPVFAYAMPQFLNNYLERFTLPSTRGVILFCTMGYYGGNSLRNSARLFKKKGFLPVGFEEIKLPGSDGLVIMKKNSNKIEKILHNDFKNSQAINVSINNIVKMAEDILDKGINKDNIRLPGLKIIALLIKPFMDYIFSIMEGKMKKSFIVDDNCINCGICQDICPSKNIVINNGKVEFSDRCYLCLRCIHQCPVEAIQIGKITRGKFRYKGPEANYKPERVLKRYNIIK